MAILCGSAVRFADSGVLICQRSSEDLGAIVVREGLAWTFAWYSVDYVDPQEEACIANRGVQAQLRARSGMAGAAMSGKPAAKGVGG